MKFTMMLQLDLDGGMGNDKLKKGSNVTDSLPQTSQRKQDRCWPPKSLTMIDLFELQ